MLQIMMALLALVKADEADVAADEAEVAALVSEVEAAVALAAALVALVAAAVAEAGKPEGSGHTCRCLLRHGLRHRRRAQYFICHGLLGWLQVLLLDAVDHHPGHHSLGGIYQTPLRHLL